MIHIYPAHPAEAAAISRLIEENTEQVTGNHDTAPQATVWGKAESPEYIRNLLYRRTIFCAYEQGRLVGTVGLEGRKIVGLYVDHTRQSKGIGNILLAHLEAHAREQGIEELVVTVVPSAIPFYEQHGYLAQGQEGVVVDGVVFEEISMRKILIR